MQRMPERDYDKLCESWETANFKTRRYDVAEQQAQDSRFHGMGLSSEQNIFFMTFDLQCSTSN